MLLTKNLKIIKSVALSMAIMLSIVSFSLSVQAAHLQTVPTQWDNITQKTGDLFIKFDENYTYTDITFINSYSYTTTSKDTTTTWDMIKGIYNRTTYTRTYTTW